MKNRILLLTIAMLFGVSSLGFAAVSKSINVSATIPTISSGLDVKISKVDAKTDDWLETSATLPIAFGTLALDPTYKVFLSSYYYAVDVGVNDNTGTAWTLTHTRATVKKDVTNNLDNNINVSFVKQLTATTDSPLQKVAYVDSNNIAYTKAQLAGGWLRIYYGIATGNTDPANGEVDAGPNMQIDMTKPAGSYSGTVTITLTP